jgi:hypothetical protein
VALVLPLLREGYRIHQDCSDACVCVREAHSQAGAEVLRKQYEGWQLTHEMLGPCAPSWSRLVHPRRLETEFIEGIPLNLAYGLRRTEGLKTSGPTWDMFWKRLERLWEYGRLDVNDTCLTKTDLWCTWFAISDLRRAKQCVWTRGFLHPVWTLDAIRTKLRYGRRYTTPPETAQRILNHSKHGLILGDLHFENLMIAEERLVFVDFTEVARGPIAFDLVWLWLEWWLAQGVVAGDDGFLSGFRRLWTRYVGPEWLLCDMTRQWVQRAFSWLFFAFYHFRLNLQHKAAVKYGGLARNLTVMVNDRALEADTLDGLLYVSAKAFV